METVTGWPRNSRRPLALYGNHLLLGVVLTLPQCARAGRDAHGTVQAQHLDHFHFSDGTRISSGLRAQ